MSDNSEAEIEQPFISHLLELRDRLLRMILAILVFFVVLFPFANDIYVFVATPLMVHLPEGTSMIATQVASPFLTPFKMSLVGSVFLAMPFILYQFWGFVAPGLYQHEKRLAVPLLVSSILLFYAGMIFAYYAVFPLVFGFLTGTAPDGVAVMTDITSYLDFVLTLFFAFGIAFEVPIATIVLVMMGVTTPEKLRTKRPYIIVGAFIIGMFLTPPDIISQTLLALPMWVLFEIGLLFSVMFVRDREARQAQEDDEPMEEVFENPAPDDGPPLQPAPATRAAAASGAATGAAASVGGTASQAESAELGEFYDDFEPLTEEEMDAELDRIDAEEAEEETDTAAAKDSGQTAEESMTDDAETLAEIDDEDDIYSDHDDHSGDGGNEAADTNLVDVKLAQVMEYRDEGDVKTARGLLYEVLEEGDESQIRVARNILAQLDTSDDD